MADDEPCRGHAFGDPLDRQPVEAEAANALVAKARGEEVDAGDLGQRLVECRVEDGNMG
jgi:hypothetical protein